MTDLTFLPPRMKADEIIEISSRVRACMERLGGRRRYKVWRTDASHAFECFDSKAEADLRIALGLRASI